MLLTVVSVAAQGAHTASTLMVSQTLCTLTAAISRSLRAVLCEMVMALAVAASDTRRPHRGTEGMDMVRRGSSVRSGLKLQLNTLSNFLPGLRLAGRELLSIQGEGAPQDQAAELRGHLTQVPPVESVLGGHINARFLH